jgi:histidinol-phosphatase (PHP family)
MLFERIESEGLAHYSYLVGDRHEALVIDPRRDCQVYIDKAAQAGMHITTILETHRNEDYLIGSVHYVSESWAIDNPALVSEWKSRDPLEVWTAYADRLRMAADSGLFDIIGHADLCKKFCFFPQQDPAAIFEPFLQSAARQNVAIELNTGGLRKDCREIYPSPAIVKRAAALGVPITFGSDAHAPNEVGWEFAKAVELARDAGYARCCRFAKRLRTEVSL